MTVRIWLWVDLHRSRNWPWLHNVSTSDSLAKGGDYPTSLEKLPTKVTYAADIQFESNSSLFTTTKLEDLIIKAKSINLEVIVILAHARSDENDPLKLSVARADAVKSLLVSSGIGPQRIHVEAKGASTIVKNVVEVEIIGTRKN